MPNKLLLFSALTFLPGILCASRQDFITVNATASKGYAQRKYVKGVPQAETYVFYQGRFFGETRDPSLQNLSFLDIAKILAPDLAKQNYFPTRNYKAANLLIVVNWGSTLTEPAQNAADPERQFQFDDKMKAIQDYNTAFTAPPDSLFMPVGSTFADPSVITFEMALNRNDQFSAQVGASYNARLLGYTEALNREMRKSWAFQDGLSAKAESYLADLGQERYFIVLLAYDYQEMQQNHRALATQSLMGLAQGASAASTTSSRKPADPVPVWAVRLNIRANGNNFTQALPAMSAMAAEYFGKQVDDLATAQVAIGSTAHVKVGETKVLDMDKKYDSPPLAPPGSGP